MLASTIFIPQWGIGMGHSTRRRVLFGFAFALVAISSGATPSLAQTAQSTRPFTAEFREQTTLRPCPPAGVPAGATCFTGVGQGTATPPGGPAAENFAGYVDNVRRNPRTGCAPDANAVVITTSRGHLFLTTNGVGCPTGGLNVHDEGTWTAHGGTGIFEGARGGGRVVTDGTFILGPDGNPVGATSLSRYSGTLTLR
jgi:hypothetical protein